MTQPSTPRSPGPSLEPASRAMLARIEADPFLFRWLCACAVYPGLRFPLTVYLGAELARLAERPPPGEDELLQLARLPWFRQGSMPDEVRLWLTERLGEEDRRKVRKALERLLFNVLEHGRRLPDGRLELDELAETPAGWRSVLAGYLEAARPGDPSRDIIFARFMMGERVRPEELELDRRLAGPLGSRLRGWIAPKTVGGAAAAALSALAIWLTADRVMRPWFEEVLNETVQGPELVVIPAGSFLMGSPGSEAGRDSDEGPQHQVTITWPFAMGRYEVTRSEWAEFVRATAHWTVGGCYIWAGSVWTLDATRSWEAPGFQQTDRDPVVCVSWQDAQAYVAWLSKRTGQPYRLPSEAEWEYAARAGTTTPFWTGATISTEQANYDGNYTYGRGRKGVYRQRTVAVDDPAFPANPFGLHHVHGNVWEWVEDCHHNTYDDAPADGAAWTTGDCRYRVFRGGSRVDVPGFLRSANRNVLEPKIWYNHLGFRVSRTLGNADLSACPNGLVPRGAVPGDNVCVMPETRAQIVNDNAQARARREPKGGAYGPDTCVQGYVWREATPEDHVCVTPDIREQTWRDNARAPRRSSSGSTPAASTAPRDAEPAPMPRAPGAAPMQDAPGSVPAQ